MPGPILRQYGFPNFEKIFGERDLQHGADESETAEPAPEAVKKPASDESDKTVPHSGKKKA